MGWQDALLNYAEKGADAWDQERENRFRIAQQRRPDIMPWDFRVGATMTPEDLDRAASLGSGGGGIGGGIPGWVAGGTRIVKQAGPRGVGYVEAFNDATKAITGRLGFRFAEGQGPRMNDIVVKPEARGQGYAKEMVDAFTDHFGPEMQKAGFSGNITESPGYWAKLRDQMSAMYPKLSQGIDYALTERYPDFTRWVK